MALVYSLLEAFVWFCLGQVTGAFFDVGWGGLVLRRCRWMVEWLLVASTASCFSRSEDFFLLSLRFAIPGPSCTGLDEFLTEIILG